MAIPRIETEEEVMFFDTDLGGVVHNIAYLRFIETARTRLAAVMGLSLKEMAETKLFPVVTRTEIDYRRPATLGDHLVIGGWLDSFTRARFWCAFEIRLCGDATSRKLITCRQSLSLVQMPQAKPVALPKSWQGEFGECYQPK